MSPAALTIAWRTFAAIFVLGMAALCWHNIHQTLDYPIYFQLADGDSVRLAPLAGGLQHATLTGDTTVGVQISRASTQLQWLLALSSLNSSLIASAVGVVFGIIWARTSAGHPFARIVTRSVVALAIIVAVFGTLQDAKETEGLV